MVSWFATAHIYPRMTPRTNFTRCCQSLSALTAPDSCNNTLSAPCMSASAPQLKYLASYIAFCCYIASIAFCDAGGGGSCCCCARGIKPCMLCHEFHAFITTSIHAVNYFIHSLLPPFMQWIISYIHYYLHSCSELFHTFITTSIHAVNYFIHSLLPPFMQWIISYIHYYLHSCSELNYFMHSLLPPFMQWIISYIHYYLHSCSELFHAFTATSIHAMNYFMHSLLLPFMQWIISCSHCMQWIIDIVNRVLVTLKGYNMLNFHRFPL